MSEPSLLASSNGSSLMIDTHACAQGAIAMSATLALGTAAPKQEEARGGAGGGRARPRRPRGRAVPRQVALPQGRARRPGRRCCRRRVRSSSLLARV
jgi:hypothetical protein